jgi:hypothetical protein
MATNQREMWYEQIKSWCNNTFDGVDVDSAPLEVQKALDILIADDANRSYGKSSKTVQGVVVDSYTTEGFSSLVRSILYKHRSMSW